MVFFDSIPKMVSNKMSSTDSLQEICRTFIIIFPETFSEIRWRTKSATINYVQELETGFAIQKNNSNIAVK